MLPALMDPIQLHRRRLHLLAGRRRPAPLRLRGHDLVLKRRLAAEDMVPHGGHRDEGGSADALVGRSRTQCLEQLVVERLDGTGPVGEPAKRAEGVRAHRRQQREEHRGLLERWAVSRVHRRCGQVGRPSARWPSAARRPKTIKAKVSSTDCRTRMNRYSSWICERGSAVTRRRRLSSSERPRKIDVGAPVSVASRPRAATVGAQPMDSPAAASRCSRGSSTGPGGWHRRRQVAGSGGISGSSTPAPLALAISKATVSAMSRAIIRSRWTAARSRVASDGISSKGAAV